jgi:hypothetical protein
MVTSLVLLSQRKISKNKKKKSKFCKKKQRHPKKERGNRGTIEGQSELC